MLDFRKVLLGLTVASLGFVGTASAQSIITCTGPVANSTPNQTVAAEGTTDLLGTITVTGCSGSANSVTVILTSDVPFTADNTSTGALNVTAVANTNIPSSIPATSITQSGNTITAVFNLGGDTIATSGVGFTFTGLAVNGSAAPATSAITIAAGGVAGGGFSDVAPAATVAVVYFTQIAPVLTGNVLGSAGSLCSAITTPVLLTTLTIAENYPGSFSTAVAPATQGVVFAITFNNLNATGVNYYVPQTVGTGGMVLTAQASATSSSPFVAATPASKIFLNTTTSATDPGILLTVVNGSATAYYAVTTSFPTSDLTAPIGLFATVPNPSLVSSPVTAPVTASSTLVGVATGYPQYVAVSTPTVISQPATPAGASLLTSCSTTLLFPYLTNQAGFDTGIAIANASTGLGGAATSGSCNVTFYGVAAPTAAYNTGTIATGTIGTIVLSAVAPGFSGYAVASCNFVQAHADAFIGQFGAGGSLSANYLAVVTTQAGGTGISAPVAF
jgi:hypothetical protein